MAYPKQQLPTGYDPYNTNTQMAYNPSANVVVPVLPAVVSFRDIPVQVNCNNCNRDGLTVLSYKVGTITWIACITIFFIGCALPLIWLGFCFIPFCIKPLKEVIHKCPHCGVEVGRFRRVE